VYQNNQLKLPLESTLNEKQAGGGGGQSLLTRNPKLADSYPVGEPQESFVGPRLFRRNFRSDCGIEVWNLEADPK
jgi:hypothetical protein